MPYPCRRVLRVEASWKSQTAVLLRSTRESTLRLRGIVGRLEGPKWNLDQDVYGSHDDSQRSNVTRSRPYAGHLAPGQLPSLAGPRHEGFIGGVRAVKAV